MEGGKTGWWEVDGGRRKVENEEKRARLEPHSECLHNGIILIVYIFQIVVQNYKKMLNCASILVKKLLILLSKFYFVAFCSVF